MTKVEADTVKRIRKIRPEDFWNIGEHESWLTDMSREGYHLESLDSFFAYFEVGAPKEINYRIIISTENSHRSDGESSSGDNSKMAGLAGYSPHQKLRDLRIPS